VPFNSKTIHIHNVLIYDFVVKQSTYQTYSFCMRMSPTSVELIGASDSSCSQDVNFSSRFAILTYYDRRAQVKIQSLNFSGFIKVRNYTTIYDIML